MRVVLKIEYDGTNYHGWQSQKNGISIQSVIEEALFNFSGLKLRITASGRTDAGVHAKGQIAHFDCSLNMPSERIAFALNSYLPDDIRIVESFEAKSDFHARYSAKRKTYSYTIYKSKIIKPLLERYAVNVQNFDIQKMREASNFIIGTHDFKAFQSTGSSVKDTIRTVYSINIVDKEETVKIFVEGNGFLYNMVRVIVGTLIGYSDGKITLKDIEEELKTGVRNKIGKTMPAKGLVLESVVYD